MSKIYSYVVRFDSGFAPNPFFGYCTLATCKPKIRKFALEDDWVVGTGSRSVNQGYRLVYAMRVTEICDFNEYLHADRFFLKRPVVNGSRKQRCGDNIYHLIDNSTVWKQEDSYHSNPDLEKLQKHIDTDTKVNRVLISEDFYYFGGDGPIIPNHFREDGTCKLVKKGPCYRKISISDQFNQVIAWIRDLSKSGYRGAPYRWRYKND